MPLDAKARSEGVAEALPWIVAFLRIAVDIRESSHGIHRSVLGAVGLPAGWRPRGRAARRVLEERAAAIARRRRRKGVLARNLQRLAADLDLDGAEAALLRFVVLCGSVDALSIAFHLALDDGDPHSFLLAEPPHVALSAVVGLPPRDVLRALTDGSNLLTCGIVRRSCHSSSLIELACEGLAEAVYLPHRDSASMLASVFHPLPEPTLTADDFPHLAADLGRIVRVLAGGLVQKATGLDVLLFGPPGTGKTELARLLVRLVGAAGVEVACQKEDRAALPAEARMDAWVACQRMLGKTPNLVVVFDEAGDAFPDDPMRRTHDARAWTHRLLEQHPLPTIWISNDLGPMDPAVLRRFDLLLEVGPPPPAVRRRILDRRLPADLTTPEGRARLAADGRWSPANLDRAARALSLFAPTSAAEGDEALVALLRPHLDRTTAPLATGASDYDLTLPSASTDLDALATGLARGGRGAVLLAGPPGTGKTAFAQVVADRAERPLLVRTCSDILDPYVGGTEQRLAATFAEARAMGAVLLIDEIDSLLRNRAGAVRGWEVSQVTELLVQIDRFEGILLCTTNRAEDVDPAARRRFAVAVRLDPPSREARRRLVARAFEQSGLVPPAGWEAAVDAIDGLTPGDVVAVRRGWAVAGDGRAETFLRLLRECRPAKGQVVGFP